MPHTQKEELRRQISVLLSLKEDAKMLTTDQVQDCWHVLEFADHLSDFKA